MGLLGSGGRSGEAKPRRARVLRPRVLVALGVMFALLGPLGDDIRDPWAIIAVMLAVHLLAIGAAGAAGLHAWRAAAASPGRRRARAVIVVAGTSMAGLIGVSLGLQMPDMWDAARDDPHWPPSRVALADGGRVVVVSGPLRWSVAREMRAVLAAAPAASAVRLDSPGGRIGAGLELHALIRAHGLDTVVMGGCASACTDAFLAGRRRWAGPEARFGFHQGALGGGLSRLIDAESQRIYADTGIAQDFVASVMRMGGEAMWEPGLDLLRAARVVTDLVEGGKYPRGL